MLNQQWAHRFFELANQLFAVLGPDGRILEANPAWSAAVGWSPEALKAEGCRGFVHPDDVEALELRLRALVGTEGRAHLSCRWRRPNGTWCWLSWNVASAPGDTWLYCTVRPMEAPPAEQPPPAGAQPPWSLSDSLPLGLYLVEEPTGRVLYANARFCQLWGIEALESALRRGEVPHAEVLQHCLRAGAAARFLRLPSEGGSPFALEEDEAVLASGRTLRRLSASVGAGREPGHYRLFVFEDITERKRTEQALQRSEQSFRKLIERAPEGIFVHRDQRFIYVNPTLLHALGYNHPDELIGESIWRIVHPDDVDLVRQRVEATSFRGELSPLREIRYVRRDGSWYDAESTGVPVEFDGPGATVVMSRDITERKRLQATLLHNDRMVLAGTLAAGVGHEINNPLTYVMANLESAIQAMGRLAGETEDPAILFEALELLQEAHEGATRVRNIVRDLKVVSRQEREERREQVDVREPLEFSLKLAAKELDHRARVIRKFESVPPVYADPSRLGQVFLNLLVNAAHAIPEGDPERNHVTVWVRPSDSGGVAVDVSDSGGGMPPAVLARIFDPFFTTKSTGAGTGLGLSICHGIIRSLGGDISVRSEPGQGTTFTILLPTQAPNAAAPEPVAEPAPAPAPDPDRHGQFLVVDDEAPVGRSLARIIGRQHQVKVVTNGQDALAALTSGDSYDAVFCDLMMPGVTGMDIYEKVREQQPELAERFIFITGGSYTPRARQFLEKVSNRQIEKPFDVQVIHQYLGEVLGKA